MLSYLTYLLLDAARMGETMDIAKEKNPSHDSLYRGRSEESLSEVAPYIFSLQGKTEFVQWVMDTGWGDSWGVFVKSPYPQEELFKHFRKFLMVSTEDGEELYFRFYDPRVLRIFLPTCDQAQLREFFGPIEYFVMEDEDPQYAIRFWLENWVLRSQKIKFEDFVGNFKLAGNKTESDASVSYSTPDLNVPGRPSMPSTPSMPSPSLPSTPSTPSMPSVPQAPSVPQPYSPPIPSVPSTPSMPSAPSMPQPYSLPSIPSAPSRPSVPQAPALPAEPQVPNITKKKWEMFD